MFSFHSFKLQNIAHLKLGNLCRWFLIKFRKCEIA